MGVSTSKPPKGKRECKVNDIKSIDETPVGGMVSLCIINLFNVSIDLWLVKSSLEEVNILTIPPTDYVVYDTPNQQGYLLKHTDGKCFTGFRVNTSDPKSFGTALLDGILYIVAGPE